jgi:hypothetical protein
MRKLADNTAKRWRETRRDGNATLMQHLMLSAATALLTLSLGGAFGVALAQNNSVPPEQAGSDAVRDQAPIGARQPRPRDLPDSVLREEGYTTPAQREFDKSLQICRDCD